MIRRNIIPLLTRALSDTPVVFLAGARQTGKSTAVEWIANNITKADYVTLDDYTVLSAAKNDPKGFISGLPEKVILDEIQRAPELFRAIKESVDKNRKPGRFLLTGSANVLVLPKLSESLAGRMEVQVLWPFSHGEKLGVKESFIDRVFSPDPMSSPSKQLRRSDLYAQIATGGYPEVAERPDSERREAWFRSYITTILQRDIKDISAIDGLSYIPDILHLLAGRCANLVNFTEIASSLKLPQTSLKRYIALLEAIFLTIRVQPWSRNVSSRLIKTPKIYLNDTGLISFLLGIDTTRLEKDPKLAGQLLENYIVVELLKQIPWSRVHPRQYHFRTHAGDEVDVVLENAQGQCVGIEIKSSATIDAKDVRGLTLLQDILKTDFVRGIVLYTGTEVVPFSRNIHAVPVNALWTGEKNTY